ncbi:MAG: hypothetical protein JRI38_01655 [Deltaproteobacteria bacterium]|nr:hypothetical protein [Deltaproteobacteria bacterium]
MAINDQNAFYPRISLDFGISIGKSRLGPMQHGSPEKAGHRYPTAFHPADMKIDVYGHLLPSDSRDAVNSLDDAAPNRILSAPNENKKSCNSLELQLIYSIGGDAGN